MPALEHIAAFVSMVEDGHYIQAMEAFCADDCTGQENGAPPCVGLPALLAHERHTLASERFFCDPRQMRPG